MLLQHQQQQHQQQYLQKYNVQCIHNNSAQLRIK